MSNSLRQESQLSVREIFSAVFQVGQQSESCWDAGDARMMLRFLHNEKFVIAPFDHHHANLDPDTMSDFHEDDLDSAADVLDGVQFPLTYMKYA